MTDPPQDATSPAAQKPSAGAPPTAAPSDENGSGHIDLVGKTCFIVMPYGKTDVEHKRIDKSIEPPVEKSLPERQHFNEVFNFINKVATDLSLKPLRSDHLPHSAPIHGKMLAELLDADLVIADITGHNPNVFYELGVRHTARPNGTIVIGETGTAPPFNIAGIRVIHYDFSSEVAKIESAKVLENAIRAHLGWRIIDSLVHASIPGLNVTRPDPVLKDRERRVAPLGVKCPNTGRDINLGYITGDIVMIDMVDVLVNPESTRMEMARIHDQSVSAFIRYQGAKLDQLGNVSLDLIYDELKKNFAKNKTTVEPGSVVVTGPGALAKQNVRCIFHIAAQHGEPCAGYQTIRSYETCVTNALDKMDDMNRRSRWPLIGPKPLRSIIFPLMGVRSLSQDPYDTTTDLVRTARNYLRHWPDIGVETVYFLAYTKRDKDLLEAAFNRLDLKFAKDSH